MVYPYGLPMVYPILCWVKVILLPRMHEYWCVFSVMLTFPDEGAAALLPWHVEPEKRTIEQPGVYGSVK